MQAIKQAAREGDFAKLDALCEEWSVSIVAPDNSLPVQAKPIASEATSTPTAPAESSRSAPSKSSSTELNSAPAESERKGTNAITGADAKKSLEKVS
jgi:hypothetical protein